MTTKLKTLKDLKGSDIIINFGGEQFKDKILFCSNLKSEAIKWVKFFRKTGIPSKHTMENDFTAFFNLTSEDLK